MTDLDARPVLLVDDDGISLSLPYEVLQGRSYRLFVATSTTRRANSLATSTCGQSSDRLMKQVSRAAPSTA